MNSLLMISGAAGGLGSALAVEAARLGFDLLLTDVRPEGAALARHLQETCQIKALYYPCDLSSAEERARLLDDIRRAGYRFWGLCNVAGIDYEGAFQERGRDQLLRTVRVNIEAALDLTNGLLAMRDTQSTFRLLNVSSLAAFQPMPYKAVYAASKRFVLDFSRALAEELAGVATVTALCPAGLPTTADTMRRIFAQGFWGRVTAMDTRIVAKRALRHALRGKRVYVPGLLNLLISSLAELVPARLAARFVARRWGTAQVDMQWQPPATAGAPAGLTPVQAEWVQQHGG